jgi:pimeloyl-ACP methyl ester carboxylesterase
MHRLHVNTILAQKLLCARRFSGLIAVWAAIAAFLLPSIQAAEPDARAAEKKVVATSPVEIWEGALDTGGIKLRLLLKITAGEDQALTATLDSVDQGAKDLKVDSIERKDGQLRFTMKLLMAEYEGKLNEAGDEVTGEFKQAGAALPLDFKRVEKAAELKRPQMPVKPYPYSEEEVSYPGPEKGTRIAGTLTLPKGNGLFAAALLITGSGSQDRDESLAGHKPFLVLADYLTRRGIAVLRVDDRGVGGSTGNAAAANTQDLAADALEGVKFLKSRPEIDAARIGLIGHSEGGLIAPLAAVKSPDVAFIVLLAGPGVTGEEILYSQGELIAKAMGAPDEAVARQRKMQEKVFQIIRDTPDQEEARQKLIAAWNEQFETLEGAEKEQAEAQRGAFETQAGQIGGPWFRFFLSYDPRPTLRKVTCPVLAIIGEKDLQVPAEANIPELERALSEGGNPDYLVQALPGLNHLFQTAETGSPTEYGTIEETIAPAALELIGDWIEKRTAK